MALALALTQVAPAAPVPEDVVVVGRRLARWKGRITTTLGVTDCRTTRSTGDRELDAVGCRALTGCWSEHRPRYEAARDKGLATDPRARMRAEAEAGLTACLKDRRDALVAQLVARRTAGGGGGA